MYARVVVFLCLCVCVLSVFVCLCVCVFLCVIVCDVCVMCMCDVCDLRLLVYWSLVSKQLYVCDCLYLRGTQCEQTCVCVRSAWCVWQSSDVCVIVNLTVS